MSRWANRHRHQKVWTISCLPLTRRSRKQKGVCILEHLQAADDARASTLLERCDERIVGVLSCYDREVITETLPRVCHPEGRTK
jgi:hypothetical protein